MTTTYPNREHRNLNRQARRRAQNLLVKIEEQAAILRTKLAPEAPEVESREAERFGEMTGALREQLAIIETLREVREWDKANLMEVTNHDDGDGGAGSTPAGSAGP